MSFGKIIAEARKRANLSQRELAGMLRREDGDTISAQYLNDIEHGRRNPPPNYLIEQLATILKVDREVLYYQVGEIPEDLRGIPVDDKRIVAAYAAFRNVITGN